MLLHADFLICPQTFLFIGYGSIRRSAHEEKIIHSHNTAFSTRVMYGERIRKPLLAVVVREFSHACCFCFHFSTSLWSFTRSLGTGQVCWLERLAGLIWFGYVCLWGYRNCKSDILVKRGKHLVNALALFYF